MTADLSWRMDDSGEPVRITGGCQCGAVRYVLHRRPPRPCICHCRMCQKSSGNLFAAFAGVAAQHFELTRGELGVFRSSDEGERCFCAACGTPLAWRTPNHDWVSVTIGSLDRPEDMRPTHFYGEEGRISWAADVVAHVAQITGRDDGIDDLEAIRRSNHQHPDHDTDGWPPRGDA